MPGNPSRPFSRDTATSSGIDAAPKRKKKPWCCAGLPDVWEDFMCSFVLSSDLKSDAGSVHAACLSLDGLFKWSREGGGKKKGFEWNEKFHQLRSISHHYPSPFWIDGIDRCVCVCVCTCLCAVSAKVTVLSKGSLIIVGVIMEISASLTIGAGDKKKNYLFWCFCFLISCPLEISRDFYYRALCSSMSLFLFSFSVRRFSIIQCVLAT